MEVHLDEGTQRLELPVSRMTLNSWGGFPTLMSEKSRAVLEGRDKQRARVTRTYTGHSDSW